jgi:hypothetical protein
MQQCCRHDQRGEPGCEIFRAPSNSWSRNRRSGSRKTL